MIYSGFKKAMWGHKGDADFGGYDTALVGKKKIPAGYKKIHKVSLKEKEPGSKMSEPFDVYEKKGSGLINLLMTNSKGVICIAVELYKMKQAKMSGYFVEGIHIHKPLRGLGYADSIYFYIFKRFGIIFCGMDQYDGARKLWVRLSDKGSVCKLDTIKDKVAEQDVNILNDKDPEYWEFHKEKKIEDLLDDDLFDLPEINPFDMPSVGNSVRLALIGIGEEGKNYFKIIR